MKRLVGIVGRLFAVPVSLLFLFSLIPITVIFLILWVGFGKDAIFVYDIGTYWFLGPRGYYVKYIEMGILF